MRQRHSTEIAYTVPVQQGVVASRDGLLEGGFCARVAGSPEYSLRANAPEELDCLTKTIRKTQQV